MPERFLPSLACWLALCGAAFPVRALDLGAGTSSAVLGAPLAFEVALKLAPGEEIDLRCLAADVAMGGVPVPASAVSVGLRKAGGDTTVQVRTAYVVHEPVVAVVVSVGCPARLTRRFTVLADPPAAQTAGALPAWPGDALAAGAVVRSAPVAARAVTEPRRASGASVAQTAGAAPAAAAVSTSGAAAPSAPAPAAPMPGEGRPRLEVGAPVSRPAEASRSTAVVGAPSAGPGIASAPAAAAALAPAPATGTSAPLAVGAAASVPDAAAADQARVQALEASLIALRVESRQQRESLARLESALAAAESQSRIAWMAAALLGGLAALASALWLRRPRGEPVAGGRWQAAWPGASGPLAAEPRLGVAETPQPATEGRAAADAPADGGESALRAAPAAATETVPRPGGASAGAPGQGNGWSLPPDPADDADVPAVERTSLMAPSSTSVSAPLHAVSIEEVLDLEQQVEFLTVLGREDAAIDLLVEHLRKTGGTHPTPFLKLMEIHRRRGEREAYERVRARFNQRFNAVAAAFGAAPAPARALQDDPALMLRIERAWTRPLDAMTLLENLMFRGEGREPLPMAALEEVVFLHALARDLDRHAGRPAILVDVLLPLEDTVTAGGASSDPAPDAGSDRGKTPKRRRAAATGGLRVRKREAQVGTSARGQRGSAADAATVDVLLEDLASAASAGIAPPALQAPAGDPWPSISDTAFDVGGLEMEPLSPPPDGRSPRGSS
jgi:hypothetical protein